MKIKISIQQPSIPSYRKKIFEKLGQEYTLDIFYGNENIKQSLPCNTNLFYSKLFKLKISFLNIELKWHFGQIRAVNSRYKCAIISWDVSYLSFWFALLISKITRTPLIVWGHGFSKNTNSFRKFIRCIPLKFVEAVILYDYHTRNELSAVIKESRIFVAPNSLDNYSIQREIDYWENNINELLNFQKENNLDKTYNLIFIGRIYKENRIELLFDLIAELKLYNPIFKLIIIGSGETEYLKKLRKKCESLDIIESVYWVGDLYDENKIAAYMMSSKVLVYPRNVGLSLIHAFNYSLPVITENSLYHGPEIHALRNGYNGLLYEPNNIKDFCSKILYLQQNEDKRNEMAKNSKNTILQKHNIDKMFQGFVDAVNYTISEK